MAQFTPNFSAVQSSDGLTITFTDLSNWSDNDEDYTRNQFSRKFILNDAYGEEIDTLELENLEDVITYSLSSNKWIEVVFTVTNLVDEELSFEKILKFPFQRLFEIAYIEAVKDSCGCCEDFNDIDLCKVDAYSEGARLSIPIGNGIEYQANIDAAYDELQK